MGTRALRFALVFFFLANALWIGTQDAFAQTQRPRPNSGPTAIVPGAPVVPPVGPVRHGPLRLPGIFFCQTSDPSCRTNANSFSIEDTRDLFVFVTWPGVSGQHVQTVDFLLPEGHLYEQKKTRFTLGGASAGLAQTAASARQFTPPAKAPHLMADANTQHAAGVPSLLASSRGDAVVVTVLPVAGTFITQRSLTGTWTVRVLLDGRHVLSAPLILHSTAPHRGAQGTAE